MDGATRIAEDREALATYSGRYAGTREEREMVDAVVARLPEGLRHRVEPVTGHTRPVASLAGHGLFLLLVGLLGVQFPGVGAVLSLLGAASLVGEGTGRFALLRWLVGKGTSANLVLPPPEREDPALGTLVLMAPLDLPRIRLYRPSWLRRPTALVLLSSMAVSGLLILRSLSEPWGTPLMSVYTLSLAVLALTSLLAFVERRVRPGEHADASAPAALLEIARLRDGELPKDLDVWCVFTGGAHAYQDGARTFLGLRGHRLDRPVLVVALADLANAPLHACYAEGPLWAQHHRPTGPALMERMRWSGVRAPALDRVDPTDARAATVLGYRALSLVGGEQEADSAVAARAVEAVRTLAEWFAQDLAGVAARRLPGDAADEDDRSRD